MQQSFFNLMHTNHQPQYNYQIQQSNQLIFFRGQEHAQDSFLLNLHTPLEKPMIEHNEPNHQTEHNSHHQKLSQNHKRSKQKGKARQSKNKNLVKFIMKLLRNQSQILRRIFGEQHKQAFQKFKDHITKLFQWQKENPKQNNLSLTQLKHILQQSEVFQPITSLKVRQALATILSRKMSALVTKNNRCTMKLVYLNTLKVYQLRCRNVKTALRLQSSQ